MNPGCTRGGAALCPGVARRLPALIPLPCAALSRILASPRDKIEAMPQTLEWTGTSLRLLDQTRLPNSIAYIDCTDERMVWDAIRRLVVRGAPAIGVSAAFGAYLGIARQAGEIPAIVRRLGEACDYLATSRPTAVNLTWALNRLRALAVQMSKELAPGDSDQFKARILAECRAIRDEDIACTRALAEHGLALLGRILPTPPWNLLTHCNAGALASAGMGTALAPMFLAHQRGMALRVYADETRPLLQGARLTAWELSQAGIPVTVLCDNMAASLMSQRRIDAVLVGADRIAANGDTANKIGTHGLAIIASRFGVPVIVLAPTSTIDKSIPDGSGIPIEHRDPAEVTHVREIPISPDGVDVYNPAFDVTPRGLIRAIVTEQGVWEP